jgi:hypothetical protein
MLRTDILRRGRRALRPIIASCFSRSTRDIGQIIKAHVNRYFVTRGAAFDFLADINSQPRRGCMTAALSGRTALPPTLRVRWPLPEDEYVRAGLELAQHQLSARLRWPANSRHTRRFGPAVAKRDIGLCRSGHFIHPEPGLSPLAAWARTLRWRAFPGNLPWISRGGEPISSRRGPRRRPSEQSRAGPRRSFVVLPAAAWQSALAQISGKWTSDRLPSGAHGSLDGRRRGLRRWRPRGLIRGARTASQLLRAR